MVIPSAINWPYKRGGLSLGGGQIRNIFNKFWRNPVTIKLEKM